MNVVGHVRHQHPKEVVYLPLAGGPIHSPLFFLDKVEETVLRNLSQSIGREVLRHIPRVRNGILTNQVHPIGMAPYITVTHVQGACTDYRLRLAWLLVLEQHSLINRPIVILFLLLNKP